VPDIALGQQICQRAIAQRLAHACQGAVQAGVQRARRSFVQVRLV